MLDFIAVIMLFFLMRRMRMHVLEKIRKHKYSQERSEREITRKAMAASEYWTKFNNLFMRIYSLVIEIGFDCMEENAEVETLIADVIEENRCGCLLLEGNWSDSYLSLMEIFEKELSQKIFNQFSRANQMAADAEKDGHLGDGESLSYCEKRRRELIEKLERAVKKLEEISTKTSDEEQSSQSVG